MRRLVSLSLVLLAACSGSTAPKTNVISVTVRDDAGVGVYRMPLYVLLAGGERVSVATDRSGVADVGVGSGGSYEVTVVPRSGYVGGASALRQTVTVAPNGRSTVSFTVYREGIPQQDPNRGIWDGPGN